VDRSACRICGLSREMLPGCPELQARFVRIRFDGPPGPFQQAWFCHTHAWLGLKYAGQPLWLAWLAILTTAGCLVPDEPRARGT
jgi:hypothetical protein